MISLGAIVFGAVVGFITYRALVRTTDRAAITDLAAVVGVIGGGVVTDLYAPSDQFAWYAIGLAAGMALYFLLYGVLNGWGNLAKVMKGETTTTGGDRDGDGGPQS